MAGAISGWRRDRPAKGGEQRLRRRMRRRAQGDAGEPGTGQIADATCWRDRGDQSQRPRPEMCGKRQRFRWRRRLPLGRRDI